MLDSRCYLKTYAVQPGDLVIAVDDTPTLRGLPTIYTVDRPEFRGES